ncbi:MAG: D-glycero-alpha-D-manno-heptose-7-phosphate kinase [Candidatus Saganbacteria bacterium]|uniref:D-glycero-alpha-D-manno-heptose-7-phosphate kinase n=1 Tax=Candidatus Saganbacteria bacterium TaxID=2575572 RepID=A0A833L517_UNCSA|nr:MAG: D-glycero-alpha-D-manno-heptose-7-phosphate kinase [Candidatus Saganbacteria bacterium]
MIISRTPFRISFFGGGTDYPIWYNDNEGAVLSASIDKYCYITCRYFPPFFNYKYRIVYSQREEVNHLHEIAHPSVRECLSFMGLEKGIEIHHDGDLPARTGLGSSSSFTVGLLNALHALKGNMVTKKQLVLEALQVEQERIKEYVGSQDQTVAAFGGFNKISFGRNHNIIVQPVTIDPARLDHFQSHLMLFFTGFSRIASDIAKEQVGITLAKETELRKMYSMVDQAIGILNSNCDLDEFGRLLNETWKIKRGLTSQISNSKIDEIYDVAIRAGASGGKLLGAGGGGFILFFVKPELQLAVKEKLGKLLHVPFRFENLGSQIVYYAPSRNI